MPPRDPAMRMATDPLFAAQRVNEEHEKARRFDAVANDPKQSNVRREEAAIKRHIAQCSVETYVMVTEEKLDTVSPCHVASLSTISGLIVSKSVPEERLTPYRSAGAAILET